MDSYCSFSKFSLFVLSHQLTTRVNKEDFLGWKLFTLAVVVMAAFGSTFLTHFILVLVQLATTTPNKVEFGFWGDFRAYSMYRAWVANITSAGMGTLQNQTVKRLIIPFCPNNLKRALFSSKPRPHYIISILGYKWSTS